MKNPKYASKNLRVLKTTGIFVAISMLIISTLIIAIPSVYAQSTINLNLYYQYHTIGLNQINRFAIEPPAAVFNTPPYNDEASEWADAYVVFTRPDGTTTTVNGPFRVDWVRRRLIFFEVLANQVGEWTFTFTWPGDARYAPASVDGEFTVQQASIPKRDTTAYLSVRPTTIGRGQTLLVNAWIVPRPILPGDWYMDYRFTFTKPDGSTDVVGPRDSYGEGSTYFEYIPDQTGMWTLQFTWNGGEFENPAQTSTQFTVQDEPIPSWPEAPLPITDSWTYPVNPENREWYLITGPYLYPTRGSGLGYDSTGQRFNPYSKAPNTAHINWKLPALTGQGGLVGGQYGQIVNYGGSGASIDVVMAGRAYYQSGGNIYCVDVRTGEQLWSTTGKYTFGLIEGTVLDFQPVLVDIGVSDTIPGAGPLNLVKYNAITGAKILDVTIDDSPGARYMCLAMDYAYAYVDKIPAGNALEFGPGNLYKISITGTGTGNRLIYNVSSPFGMVDIGVCLYNNILTVMHFGIFGDSGAFDTNTGEVLWSAPIEDVLGSTVASKPEHVTSANGIEFINIQDGYWAAMEMETGNVKWISEQADLPWGPFWAYGHSTAYGNLYALSYAGVYAYNQDNGEIVWHYVLNGSGLETPYNTWPFGSNDPVVADGKVFAPTSEHSPAIYYRGQRLCAIDAYTGDPVWEIMGYYSVPSVAEGTLFALNAYDFTAYAFAKGETKTSVTVLKSQIGAGETVGISGSILDMSPAQPGTACVSAGSMTAWMEYLHMQQQCPEDVTGVPIRLDAIRSDGSIVNIGTVMSNVYGNFTYQWNPSSQDAYTIVASFEGDDSYYSSYSTTTVNVGSAAVQPSPTISPTGIPPGGGVPALDYLIVAAVVIIIVVTVVAIVLRRRR